MPPISLIYGLSVGIRLTPDGRLTIFDWISIIFVLKYFRTFTSNVYLRRTTVLFAVYGVALIVSTLVNHTPLWSLLRRGGTALLLLIDIAGIYLFLIHSKQRDIGILIVAMMLAAFLYFIYPVDSRMTDEPLKFLLATPITVLVGALFFNIKLPQFAASAAVSCLALIFAAIFFLNGDRNPGGILIGFSVLVWCSISAGRRRELMHRRILLFNYFLMMAVGAYGMTELYTYAAIAGYFGDRAAGIAEFQSQVLGSILLGGRPEILVNLIALAESPLVGWGPLAEDAPHQLLLMSLGVYGQDWLDNDGSLYHSMVFGAGHEAGFPAMLVWIALLYWCCKASIVSLSKWGRYKYFLPLLLNAMWNLLFSPLVSLNRPQIAAAVAFAFMCFALPELQVKMRPYRVNLDGSAVPS
jgi:hypothetical protein